MTLADRILKRRYSYRATFNTPAGKAVLADLQRFCFGNAPTVRANPVTGVIDPNASLVAAARQEVWMRIINHLHLDDAALLQLREDARNDD